MTQVRIGIGLPNQVREVNPTVIPQWAVQAEEAGFSTLGTVGRQAYPSVTDTVALAVAAAVTSKIELMSTVLLAATWPATLLAKELAGIDGISGNRLTLAIGSGGRADDFIPPAYGTRGRGERLDRDLETFRDVWHGEPFGGGMNPAVPTGTRRIPMLFGGFAPAVMERMARWGEGYIGGPFPAQPISAAQSFCRTAGIGSCMSCRMRSTKSYWCSCKACEHHWPTAWSMSVVAALRACVQQAGSSREVDSAAAPS